MYPWSSRQVLSRSEAWVSFLCNFPTEKEFRHLPFKRKQERLLDAGLCLQGSRRSTSTLQRPFKATLSAPCPRRECWGQAGLLGPGWCWLPRGPKTPVGGAGPCPSLAATNLCWEPTHYLDPWPQALSAHAAGALVPRSPWVAGQSAQPAMHAVPVCSTWQSSAGLTAGRPGALVSLPAYAAASVATTPWRIQAGGSIRDTVRVSTPGGLANYTPHLNFLYFQNVLH